MPAGFDLNRYNGDGTSFALSDDVVTTKYQKEIMNMSEDGDNSTGNNLIWAVTLIIVVALIAGALYYSGFLGGTKRQQQKIDVEVSAPGPSR